MYVQSIKGNLPISELGVTLPHEHIIMDFCCAFLPHAETEGIGTEPFNNSLVEFCRRNPQSLKQNLVIDFNGALEDLAVFKKVGGKTIVELTSEGLHPAPLVLRRISTLTGLNIIVGCGFYRYMSQNENTLKLKSSEISDFILKGFYEGVNGTNIKAGVIGEVGTSFPFHPFEIESLIGSAKAQKKIDTALYIHPDISKYCHLEILNIVERAGANLEKTVMCHADQLLDTDWHKKILERSVFLAFDTFGSEFSYENIDEPKDTERIVSLLKLIEAGYIDRLLLSQDFCYQIQYHKFGGNGYDHIVTNIVPILKNHGVTDKEIKKILIDNPARLLSTPYLA